MPLPVILVTVAVAVLSPPNTISVRSSKSVTSSLKVMATLNAPPAAFGTVNVLTCGDVVSISTVYASDASFPFPAVSFAASAGTWKIKSPFPVGVMVAV